MSALTDKTSYQSRSSSRLHPLSIFRVHKRCTATVVVWRPTRVIRRRYRAYRIGESDSPSSSSRGPLTSLGQWFRKWRIEVNPDKSAAIQFSMGLRTPTISKYMKDASKRFFDIAGSHPMRLRAAVDYQPPHPTHP
ncbi:hypothetical protein EVAR_38263_1 [Eumeta japonica]|uniref:Uncharacterized protein n=1 Tax=Eumeta variegata TaxID=151549 RepID=A0A4C1YA75_EUMVA|nr:hypothetical protein EVAR_38263_1 [Eumeta japonica]